MKLKYTFEYMDMLDDTIAVPISNDGEEISRVIKVNGVTVDILNLLQKNTTEEAVIDAMLKEYDATREEMTESVHGIIVQLREEGLLAD